MGILGARRCGGALKIGVTRAACVVPAEGSTTLGQPRNLAPTGAVDATSRPLWLPGSPLVPPRNPRRQPPILPSAWLCPL